MPIHGLHPNLSMCVVPTAKFADGMAAIAANQFAEVRTQPPIVNNSKYISIIKTQNNKMECLHYSAIAIF